MLRSLAVLLLAAVCSGCAFTVYDVNVDYEYQQEVSADLGGTALSVGEFSDAREVENPRLIMNQTNMNGQTTSGGWQAEKPLNEITRDAVVDGLTKANAGLSDDASLELTGELLDYDGETVMGMWQSTFKGVVSVKLQLKDRQTDRIVWRDTFTGAGEYKGKNAIVESFRVALDDLVTDILTDDYFLQQLRGQ